MASSMASTARAPATVAGKAPPPPKPASAGSDGIRPLMRGPALFGLVTVLLFFGVFGGWAALAPLASGAVAPGVVSPDSSRKVIQHLEGGIISVLHVREGQRVARGDPLVTLEATRAEASFSSRREQWLRLLVVRARLEAHVLGRGELVLPAQVAESSTPALEDFVATQTQLFAIRQSTLAQQQQIHQRQVEQLESEIASLRAENQGLQRQAALIDQEIADKSGLLDQQLIARSEVTALQREQARLMSAVASNDARIAQAGQSIEEVRLQQLQTADKFRDEVAQESTQVNNELAQLDEDMVSTQDVLQRTEIQSPVDGIVLNLRNQTTGGVIRPGDPIMDIVPLGEDLVILARLAPKDIDVVKVGLPAQVTLLPFASRNALPLHGEVTQVAADSTLDEATRQTYYEIRIRVAAAELARHDGFYLSPGMPADVTVVTGERTMLEYLLEPFLRSLRSAFVYD